MQKKAVVFNGPPGSGKDVFSKAMTALVPHSGHFEIKKRLFEIALAMSGLSQEKWDSIYTEELKEVPTPLLFGLSPRQFLILISEKMVKPNLGKDYFIKESIKVFDNHPCQIAFYSDGGFPEEAEPLINYVGRENLMIIRLYRDGCGFKKSGDSRNYLPKYKGVCDIGVQNNAGFEEMKESIFIEVDKFLRQS